MRSRPLASIALYTAGLAGLAAALIAGALTSAGRFDWSVGVLAGWLAGGLNVSLLAVRVSRLTARSSVSGFLYGTASRFALVGLFAIGSYRLLGASPLGFAIGIALVVLMQVPVSLVWTLRQGAAA